MQIINSYAQIFSNCAAQPFCKFSDVDRMRRLNFLEEAFKEAKRAENEEVKRKEGLEKSQRAQRGLTSSKA